MLELWDIDGLIIMGGEGYWTRLTNVALVTDCQAWRRAHPEAKGEETAEKEAADTQRPRQKQITGSRAFFRAFRARLDGAPSNQALIHAEFGMALYRLPLRPQQVTRQNLNEYLQMLLDDESKQVEQGTFEPAFLFDADLPTPTLYGTDAIDLALTYCSSDLLSIHESEVSLKQRIGIALLELLELA